MKKIIFAIVFAIMTVFCANAQPQGDDFFRDYDYYMNRIDAAPDVPWDAVGYIIVNNAPQQEPLGSGLLILTALGAGYAIRKKKKKKL